MKTFIILILIQLALGAYIKLNDERIETADILNAAQNLDLAMGNPGNHGHWSNPDTIRYNLGGLTAGG